MSNQEVIKNAIKECEKLLMDYWESLPEENLDDYKEGFASGVMRSKNLISKKLKEYE